MKRASTSAANVTDAELASRIGRRDQAAFETLMRRHNGKLFLTMLAAFDAHASDQNAVQVRDVMTANAEAGYWNGAKPPFGYRTAVATVLRNKEKKVLAESGEEAPVVRLIFRLYLEGDGLGPMGIKKIVAYLQVPRGVARSWSTTDSAGRRSAN